MDQERYHKEDYDMIYIITTLHYFIDLMIIPVMLIAIFTILERFNILESKGLTPSSPLLTMMASALTNKDTFTGKDITMQTDTDQEKIAKSPKLPKPN